MAKNYTAYDAAKIISEGINKNNALEYQDIMRRFPFFGAMCTKVNEEGLKLLECLPEYMTARKFNRYLKDLLGVSDPVEDDLDEAEEEEKPKKKEKKEKPAKKAKKAVEEDDDDDLDDEDEEDEVKPKKKPAKKSKKVEEDDDDDDFDFDDED